MTRLGSGEIWQELPQDLIHRLWAVEHFQTLPSDPKLQAISGEGLLILHHSWLRTLPEDSVKRRYWEKRAAEAQGEDQDLRRQLRDLHYSDAKIEEILKEMAGAK